MKSDAAVDLRHEALKRYGDHQQEDIVQEAEETVTESHLPPRIRCPKCGWEADGQAHWTCTRRMDDGSMCETTWNTFETHGVCPGCHWEWRDTACPRCFKWSPHEDWYEKSSESPR